MDAAAERRRGLELAYAALARRDRTEQELRSYLEARRVEPAAIEDAVAELSEAGYLDDARYAERFAEDRRALARWGSERIQRDLRRRGVAAEHVERALAGAVAASELESALALLGERYPRRLAGDGERGRAFALLVRRGYDTETAYDAVREHERELRGA